MSKKLTEIIMRNIKGQDSVQQLTGKDIICGPNGVGKTTRLQALGISLLGYVPGQGKKAEETFKHSNSDTMEVGLRTEDFSFTREFKKKSTRNKDGSTKVSIQQSLNVSPSKGESKIAEKEARILAELGNFPVMLDFNEFLNLSDSKRREFIYNLAGFKSEEWTKAKVKGYLEEKLLTMDLEVNNPEQFEIMKELISEVLKEYPENYDVSTGLQSMIDWAKVKLSYWNDEKKKSVGAVKKLAELKNQLTETDRNLKTNKVELERLQSELIKAEKQISEDTQKKKNIDLRLNKIEQLKKEIEVENNKQNTLNTAELETSLKAEKAKLKKVDNSNKINELNANITKLQSELKKIISDKDEVKDKGIELKTKIDTLKDTLSKINGIELEKDNIAKEGTETTKKVHRCVLDGRIKCEKDFTPFIKHTEGEIKTLSLQKDILLDTYEELKKKSENTNSHITEFSKEINNLVEAERAANKWNNDIMTNISNIEAKISESKSFDVRKQDRIQSLKKDLEKYQNEPIEAIAPLDMLQKQTEGLRSQIATLKTKIHEEEEARTTLSNLKSSMIDSKKADYYSVSCKSLDDVLGAKGLQGELVKETLEPIQNDIQSNLSTMGIANEFYFSTESEAGKEIFQFGWKDKFGDKRNFDALSTGQQMMLLIAILTTFIEKSNPAVRILAIDNIENLDSNNLKKVLDGLNKLSDRLDNIILSGVIAAADIEGFKVWNLTENTTDEVEGMVS